MRKTIAYLGYGLGLMLLVYYGLNYQEALHIEAGRNYDPFPLMQFNYVYSLMIGMYIALPRFIRRMALKGTLSVNWFQADIVKNDDQTGYLVNDGKDTVYFIRTELNYRLKFENMPVRSIRQPRKDLKIKVEPQDELRSLFSEDIF